MEIARNCNSGIQSRIVRRLATQPKDLILDVTEQLPNRRSLVSRLVLEKQ